MGIYDREYYREPRPAGGLALPRSAVINIIIINVALYLIDALFFAEGHQLTYLLATTHETLTRPWLWWQFVTYGFVHDPAPYHIFFNMLQLFFLGREVEYRYGTAEFWRLYVTMLVVGAIIFAIHGRLAQSQYGLYGASGAVSGVVILFVLNNPFARLMLFPIPITIPAWVLGVLLVAGNVWGAVVQIGQTAYSVHLVGLGFAFLYFRLHWNLGSVVRTLTGGIPRPSWPGSKRLKIHRPPESDQAGEQPDDVLEAEVDRILEKISQFGEHSLTAKERRTLQRAAEEFRKRLSSSHERD